MVEETLGILTPQPALASMRDFFNRYYLIKPPDLMLIEWMHGDWPGGMRTPTLKTGMRECPPHTASASVSSTSVTLLDNYRMNIQLLPLNHPRASYIPFHQKRLHYP